MRRRHQHAGIIDKPLTVPADSVLVVEMIMPDGQEPHPPKFMGLNMLAMTEGGTERTREKRAETHRGEVDADGQAVPDHHVDDQHRHALRDQQLVDVHAEKINAMT